MLERAATLEEPPLEGADPELLAAIRNGLAALADPVKAGPMRAYLRSALPMLGVQTAQRRRLAREAAAAHPPAGFEGWRASVLTLWRQAAWREERCAAVELVTDPSAARWRNPAALPLLDELVVDGAWWDLVDPVATIALGELLRRHRAAVTPVVLEWSRSAHHWRRRAAIICQIGAKDATDLGLLYACIEPSLGERDRFLRKAIGWALREHAKTDPAEVGRYLDANEARLSPLSRREAGRHLPGGGRAGRR